MRPSTEVTQPAPVITTSAIAKLSSRIHFVLITGYAIKPAQGVKSRFAFSVDCTYESGECGVYSMERFAPKVMNGDPETHQPKDNVSGSATDVAIAIPRNTRFFESPDWLS